MDPGDLGRANRNAQRLSDYEYSVREERARRYDEDYEFLHGPWLPDVEFGTIVRLLDLGRDDVLLDLGCGTGRLTARFARLCERVVAVDRSTASLDVLRGRLGPDESANVEVLLADLTQPLRLPPVSKAVSVQLLQHIPSREARRSVIRNAHNALLPGGRALFINEVHGFARRVRSKPPEVAQPDALFFHPFSPPETRADLEAVGFESVRTLGCGVLYWSRYRYLPIALVKLDTWLACFPGASLTAKFVAAVGTKPAG